MFDAKSLIEMMVRGAGSQSQRPSANASAGQGGLGDLLGQLGSMIPQGGGAPSAGNRPGNAPAGLGLDDLLRQIAGAGGSAGGTQGRASADAGRQADHDATPACGMGGLGDILGKLQEQLGQGARPGAQGAGAGNIMDILGQVLGQATAGVKEGAGRIGAATGANDALGRATGGAGVDDMMAKLKEMIAQNQFGAGAAAGGLGAVILGTETGRSVAASAAKIGALALIGGLAFKAYQNYQAGRPLISTGHMVAEAAPDGSGFEPDAVTNEAAILYIRAMIAAASADGRVDQAEMSGIIGNLKQAGFDAAAEEFLADELNQPTSIDTLVESCASGEQAVQVYTAARIAIAVDSPAEQAFLSELATKLGIAPELAAHIDAATRNHAA